MTFGKVKNNDTSSIKLAITGFTVTTSLGAGNNKNLESLLNGTTGLKNDATYEGCTLDTYLGKISELDSLSLPEEYAIYDSRNNCLLWYAISQDDFSQKIALLKEKYTNGRIGVFIGTTTSGIQKTEQAYKDMNGDTFSHPYNYNTTHNLFSCTDFLKLIFGIEGIAYSVSTACSSSSKVFGSAHRAIHSGMCDAAIVGGVDTLCLTTLYGFNSLQLLSNAICKPFSEDRSGLSLGEGAGFAIVEKECNIPSTPLLTGYGESSDAFHMSRPHAEGKGVILAMQNALRMACIKPPSVDYINMHGTGTQVNDIAEAEHCRYLFDSQTHCSSTKGWTGHTLGAAGIIEAIYSIMALKESTVFQNLNTSKVDTGVNCTIARETFSKTLNYVMSNSFGFGGTNCSLIFELKT